MKWPFISRLRHEQQLAAEQAETLRVKKGQDELWQRHDAVAAELAETRKVNGRLTKDLAAARERLDAFADGSAVSEEMALYRAEKRRADHLQSRLDDAVGIPKAGIRDSARWQPGYVDPKADTA